MDRKRMTVVLAALAAGLGVHLGGSGTASAAELSYFWDGSVAGSGTPHIWTYGMPSWNCDAAWTGDGYDHYRTYVGAGWNDRYSSGHTGFAQCGVQVFDNANLTGADHIFPKNNPPSEFPRNFVFNNSLNNRTSSLGWS